MANTEINFFGETSFRNARKKFGIRTDDRRRHVYVIGKTGMGKTAMIQNMAIQDIQNGKGVGFVDPHGEAAEELLEFIPSSRINDVIYFNPADLDYPIAFNVMEKVSLEFRHLVAGGLMGVFKKIWPDVWSARMEYILNNTILALLEYPGATLLGVNRMLSDAEFRKKVVDNLKDPVIKSFWVTEYARYAQNYEVEATAAIQNKVGQFISAPLIRNVIGQVTSSIDMRKVMDEGKILILNLSKGRIGEDNSTLLGALLITKLQLAAMSRVDIPEKERRDFFLYVDEFQNFATESFATILSEARKYRLALILAHQYINQMEEEVRDAVFGNVGTIVSFRVGAEDAEFLEKEFQPEFMATDIVNLTKYNIYLRLMIDGVAARPFSAITLPPASRAETSNRDKIINASRERYGTSRLIVEEKIINWLGIADLPNMPIPKAKQPTQPLYKAQCATCGKETRVVFPPDGVRPVYCKNCLKQVRPNPQSQPQTQPQFQPQQQRAPISVPSSVSERPAPNLSLDQAAREPLVSFGKPRSAPAPSDGQQRVKKIRKPVDLGALKQSLKEALGRIDKDKKE